MREALDAHCAALPDVADNAVEFDEEGNPTNIPDRELKTLAIKPAEPESKVAAAVTPFDALADVWDTPPGRAGLAAGRHPEPP